MCEFLSSEVNELISDTQLKGGQLSKTEIRYSPQSGHGVYATASISPGDILIEIPFAECISIDRILKSPLSVIFQDNPDILSYPDEILCLGLMYGLKNPACEWIKHLNTVPKSYDLTIFWDSTDIELLRGSMMYHLTGMMLRQIQSDWDSLHHPIIQNYPELLSSCLTIDDYKWALATFYSRAIGLTRHGQYVRCIVPVLDLVNHHPSATQQPSATATAGGETFNYNEADDTILFVSTKEYAAGEECFASYGPYSNSKLLYTYGFILPSATDPAPPRTIDMWSTLSQSTPYYSIKQQFLQSHPLTAQQTYDFTGTLRGGGFVSRALLASIRVIQATEEEMNNLPRALEGMISVRNERASYQSLFELLSRKFQQVLTLLHLLC
jgi:hypothetical protein